MRRVGLVDVAQMDLLEGEGDGNGAVYIFAVGEVVGEYTLGDFAQDFGAVDVTVVDDVSDGGEDEVRDFAFDAGGSGGKVFVAEVEYKKDPHVAPLGCEGGALASCEV
jgi:hypothetical protein